MYPVVTYPSQSVMANGAVGVLKNVALQKALVLHTPSIKAHESFEKGTSYLLNACVESVASGTQAELNTVFDTHLACDHDGVVAFGGGRVLDFSKIVRQSLYYRSTNYIESVGKGKPNIRLIMLPTYPGSGSEANGTASILMDGRKTFFVNPTFMPDLIVHDLKFLDTLDERLVAHAVADIFTHAVESYMSKRSNALVKAWCSSVFSMLNEFDLEQWNSKEGKEKLFVSGYLAGMAVGVAFAGACHALAHAYEMISGKSHGQSVLNFCKANILYHKNKSNDPAWNTFLELYEKLGIGMFREETDVILAQKEKLLSLAIEDGVLRTDSLRLKQENLEVILSLL